MRLMAEHRVPPTPSNFHVWFNYASGAASDLKRSIDIPIANKRPFDAATDRELFASFMGSQASDLSAVDHASHQLQSVMTAARRFLTTAIADNCSQMQAIDDVAGPGKTGLDRKVLVESLMHELARLRHARSSCRRALSRTPS